MRPLNAAIALAGVGLSVFVPSALAGGALAPPVPSPAGTYGGIAYRQYDGIFEGKTSTGRFRVPYRITAPAQPARSNRTVLVEPSHTGAGLGALERYLGRDLLLPRGFIHAGIGWSTATFGKGQDLRILDPAVRGAFIKGGFHEYNGRTDDEIIADFARALATDPTARSIVGRTERRYLTGFSDSSDPVLRVVTSGRAAGVFDLALPFAAHGHDPQAALGAGRFPGKLIIVDSEADDPAGLVDAGELPDQYRFFAVAGAPHVPDFPGSDFFANRSTPATFVPELRAQFLAGHNWVRAGAAPPRSTHLSDHDANGNAIAVDATGQRVPRLPFVELGEARFVPGFTGTYDNVRTIAQLGFANHDAYVWEFSRALADLSKAGHILEQDAAAMRGRAALHPPLTFTQTYRDHYDEFAAAGT